MKKRLINFFTNQFWQDILKEETLSLYQKLNYTN